MWCEIWKWLCDTCGVMCGVMYVCVIWVVGWMDGWMGGAVPCSKNENPTRGVVGNKVTGNFDMLLDPPPLGEMSGQWLCGMLGEWF